MKREKVVKIIEEIKSELEPRYNISTTPDYLRIDIDMNTSLMISYADIENIGMWELNVKGRLYKDYFIVLCNKTFIKLEYDAITISTSFKKEE
jgi:hypothetical protein